MLETVFDFPPWLGFSGLVPNAPESPVLFFTAFEPSGDDHASAVIRELRTRHPDLAIHAWGGPKMAAAGAEIIRDTGDDAVMGLPGPGKINRHLSYNRKIGRWLDANKVTVHIPVDSPAANFPICKLTRKHGIKIVHLVAPQIWAWAGWRIRKLRRLTDHVLCLLPFEEKWFESRGVKATFIGHPVFDEPLQLDDAAGQKDSLPEGEPRVALMPGSRPSEVKRNFPLLLEAFRQLKLRSPGLAGVVAATNDHVADNLQAIANRQGGWPADLGMIVGGVDIATRWCDVALAVSGTVTLHITKQHRPMVVVYRLNPFTYNLVARWVINTEHFALPNLIANRRIVPEFVPYFGGPDRLVREAARLIESPEARRGQEMSLREVARCFEGKTAAIAAADAIEKEAGLTSDTGGAAPSLASPGASVEIRSRPMNSGASLKH